MTLKRLFLLFITLILLVSGRALALESLDNSSENNIINVLDLPAYRPYEPKKNEIVLN